MSTVCRLILYDKSGKTYFFNNCISFRAEYEIYTPYSQINASFIAEESFTKPISEINKLYLYLNGEYIHYGLADELTLTRSGTGRILNVSSRGFTVMLGQNQPQPGINSNVTLESLITSNLTSSLILSESDTPTVNYINVKENSNLWDAIIAYSVKANGFYPYIRGNTVFISLDNTKTIETGDNFIERGDGLNTSNMLSEVYMKDIDDEYSLHRVNSKAAEYNIERVKYYALDYQWLSDSDVGLGGKIDYSNRKSSFSFYSYSGYNGEKLMDMLSSSDSGLDGKRISKIVISGSRNSVITQIWCYNDYLSQRR
ncbi:MAG: hypothetical protein ACI4I6_06115 [Hominimerdicola sp.]